MLSTKIYRDRVRVRSSDIRGGAQIRVAAYRQDRLERFYVSAGLGMLRYSPGGVGGSGLGEESLGFPAETAVPMTWTLDKWLKMRQDMTRQDEMTRDEYETAIYNNDRPCETEKFVYLRSYLTGAVARAVKGVKRTDSN